MVPFVSSEEGNVTDDDFTDSDEEPNHHHRLPSSRKHESKEEGTGGGGGHLPRSHTKLLHKSVSAPQNIVNIFKGSTMPAAHLRVESSTSSASLSGDPSEREKLPDKAVEISDDEGDVAVAAAREEMLLPADDPEVLAAFQAAAVELCERFVRMNAPEQININGMTRTSIERTVAEGRATQDTFLPAENEILSLLERDSFGRFKQSDLFRDFLEAAETYIADERGQREMLLRDANGRRKSSRTSKRFSATAPSRTTSERNARRHTTTTLPTAAALAAPAASPEDVSLNLQG